MEKTRAAWQWLLGETSIPRWIVLLIITGWIAHWAPPLLDTL